MRLVLRKYERLSYGFKTNEKTAHSSKADQSPYSKGTQQNRHYSRTLKPYDKNQGKFNHRGKYQERPQVEWTPASEKETDIENLKKDMELYMGQQPGLKMEGQWDYVYDSLMLYSYDLLKPFNRRDTSRQLIRRYENNLNLSMKDHLQPKLYEEVAYIKRTGKYHISEMGPLAESFLRQGYNFLDKKLILHLLQTQNTKIIKHLLLGGAFQGSDAVDHQVLAAVFASYSEHQRNHFLINIVPYHYQLVDGQVLHQGFGKQQAVVQHFDQQYFLDMMYRSSGSPVINRLHLLWSLQRKYMHSYNLMEYILPELKKLTFQRHQPRDQILVDKEVNFTVTTLFKSQVFEDFFFEVIQTTKTYANFFKAWSVIIMILSKLRSIPKFLQQKNLNEIHPLFQLMELNLPKDMAKKLLKQNIFYFISQEHNQMELENYTNCLLNWQSSYLQPEATLYNSALTAITNDPTPTLTVVYRQHHKAEPIATTSIVLHRKKIEEKPAVTTQSQVIHDVLKGNYQSVFDDFLVRYSLPSDFDKAYKFHAKLKQIDKNLSFRSKKEQALYKLKQANNFFFIESCTSPLKRDDLKRYKINLGVISNLDREVLDGSQMLEDYQKDQLKQYSKEVDKEIDSMVEASLLKDIQSVKNEEVEKESWDEIQAIQGQGGAKEELLKQYHMLRQIIKMIKENNVEGEELPIRQLVDMIKQLLDNKLITKNFFGQFRKMPFMKQKQEATNLLNKYQQFYKSKLEQFRRQQEQKEENQQRQTAQTGEPQKAQALTKQQQNQKQNKSNLKAVLRNSVAEEEENQAQKNLASQKYKNELSEDFENSGESESDISDILIDNAADMIKRQTKDEHQTEIDGARDDRALYFAGSFNQYHEMLGSYANEKKQEDGIQPIQLEGLNQEIKSSQFQQAQHENGLPEDVSDDIEYDQAKLDPKRPLTDEEINQNKFKDDIWKLLMPIEYYQQGVSVQDILQITAASRYVKKPSAQAKILGQSQDKKQSEDQPQPGRERDWKRPSKKLFQPKNREEGAKKPSNKLSQQKQRKSLEGAKEPINEMFKFQNRQPVEGAKKREMGFFKKIKAKFCTSTTQIQEDTATQRQEDNSSTVTTANLFDLEKIEVYRKQEVSKDFYNLMQLESHIPQVGEGSVIAKYLFLQGRRQDGKGRVDPNKVMTIQFSSVVGTRTKNYEKYIKNTIYSFELEEGFYKSLLEDQVKSYNRNQFKLIVAHMIHYKSALPDEIVALICEIAERQLIGYSLVQIAQFIKANSITLSSRALESIAKTWQRFDLINEDLPIFLKEYCSAMSIPFNKQYYAHFCKSLILTKKFEKLQALCDLVLGEIRPRPFKAPVGTANNEAPVLEKSWKIKQNQLYAQRYLELLQVIAINLDTNRMPQFIVQLYGEYIKLRPNLDEKELGYGLVCFCLKKQKFYQLLVYLENNPKLGTSFMYDCGLKALLGNFQQLQEFAQKLLDSTIVINRIVLSKEQIMKSMPIFKRASTSNAFSKFLEHCLRFQEDINNQQEIKRDMFYVLNNNVEEVSVTGIFNLLDFIFNEKRQKQRIEYRAIRLSEEQKQKRLKQINKQAITTNEVTEKVSEEKASAKEKKAERKQQPASQKAQSSQSSETNVPVKPAKLRKKDVQKSERKDKRQKLLRKSELNQMADYIVGIQSVLSPKDSFKDDEEIINKIKSQGKRHESYKRKGVQAFGRIYRSSIEKAALEQEAIKEQNEKKLNVKDQKPGKQDSKGKGKRKN